MEELPENFVITVSDKLDCQSHQHFIDVSKVTLASFNILSTGNQFGAGCSEYFFAVDPTKLDKFEMALIKQMEQMKLQGFPTQYIHFRRYT